jgi:hypothetical protein
LPLQACLGLGISAVEPRIWFPCPRLPDCVGKFNINELGVAGASFDIELTHYDDDAGVRVLRREGVVDILVVK